MSDTRAGDARDGARVSAPDAGPPAGASPREPSRQPSAEDDTRTIDRLLADAEARDRAADQRDRDAAAIDRAELLELHRRATAREQDGASRPEDRSRGTGSTG